MLFDQHSDGYNGRAVLDDVELAMPYVSSWLTVASRHIATGSALPSPDGLPLRA